MMARDTTTGILTAAPPGPHRNRLLGVLAIIAEHHCRRQHSSGYAHSDTVIDAGRPPRGW